MAEWGRKEYSEAWPSRISVWTWAILPLTVIFFAGALTVEYMAGLTEAQRLYLADYMKSGARSQASPTATAKYELLEGVTGKEQRLLIDNEIEPVRGPDGRHSYRLTDEGVQDGIVRLEYVTATYKDRANLQRSRVSGFCKGTGRMDGGVFRSGTVRGDPQRPTTAEGMETWSPVARAGVGDDGGVQYETGPS